VIAVTATCIAMGLGGVHGSLSRQTLRVDGRPRTAKPIVGLPVDPQDRRRGHSRVLVLARLQTHLM
jgi:hypothetical protein